MATNNEDDNITIEPMLPKKQNGHLTPEPTEQMMQDLFMYPPRRQQSMTEQAKACLCSITFLAMFTTICCNLVLGIPAIVLAVLAHSTSESQTQKTFSRISLILSLLGIVSGVIFLTCLIVYIVTR